MNKFDILLAEIKECNIRTQSQEVQKVLDYLEHFANGLGSDWISVDDKLPERQEKVIVANQHTNDVYTGQIMARKGYIGWVVDDDDFNEFTVTHWQHFPQPPKE